MSASLYPISDRMSLVCRPQSRVLLPLAASAGVLLSTGAGLGIPGVVASMI